MRLAGFMTSEPSGGMSLIDCECEKRENAAD
jgi:hypothetical protein